MGGKGRLGWDSTFPSQDKYSYSLNSSSSELPPSSLYTNKFRIFLTFWFLILINVIDMDIRWLHSHHEEPLVLQAGRPLQQVQLCWDQSGDEPGTRQVQGNLQQMLCLHSALTGDINSKSLILHGNEWNYRINTWFGIRILLICIAHVQQHN